MRFALLLFICLLLLGCSNQKNFDGLASDMLTITALSDTLEKKGASVIHSFSNTDTTAAVTFTLKKGFPYPYAGITFDVKDSVQSIDLSQYDSLYVTIKSEKDLRLRLFIRTDGTDFDKSMHPDRYLRKFVEISKGVNVLALSLDEFIEPNWWLRETNTRKSELPKESFSQVLSFGTNSTTLLSHNVPYSYEITQFEFTQSSQKSMTLHLAILYGVGFIIFLLIYRKSVQNPKPRPHRTGHLAITYEELHTIDETIKSNLNHFNLSSVTIAEITGLDIKLVISTVKEHYGVSVKQHINALRVSRAKEMLRKSNTAFEEIAHNCGYANSADFEKLFISVTGKNPSAYRTKY